MLEHIFLNVIFATLLKPEVPIEKEYYPSGLKEADDFYKTDKPSKQNALLRLHFATYDAEFNKINPGVYLIDYSLADNILLIQDQKRIMRALVLQVVDNPEKKYIPSVKIEDIKDNKVFILYKNKNLIIKSFLYLPEAVPEPY